MSTKLETFWELLNKLGACHQAELEAARAGAGCPSSEEERHRRQISTKSEDEKSEGQRLQDEVDMTGSRSGSSIESVRVPTHGRLRSMSKPSFGSFDNRSADGDRFFRETETQYARTVGHTLQEQLACQAENKSGGEASLFDEQVIVFHPWQAWSPDEVRRQKRHRTPQRPASTVTGPDWTDSAELGGTLRPPAEDRLVFSPVGFAQVLRDLLSISFVTLDLILLPLRVFPDIPSGSILCSLLWVSQIFWNLRMLLMFNTGYYFRGHLVRNRRMIARRYLQTWLVFDAVSAGVDWLLAILDPSHNFSTRIVPADVSFAVLCLWVLQASLRLCRICIRAQGQSVSDVASARWIILQSVGQILLVHHVLACAWYAIDAYATTDGWTHTHVPDGAGLPYKYTTSLHWTFCQLGFGSSEIEAVNTPERMFSLLVVFAALVVFSTLLAAITTMATKLNKASDRKQEHFRQLLKYMKQHHIDRDLQMRVFAFLEHAYALRQAVVADSEVPILDLLSKPLQAELHTFRYIRCLNRLDVMTQLCHAVDQHSIQAIKSLPKVFSHRTFAPADTVFECGLLAKAAYFIDTGEFVYELNGFRTRVEKGRWVAEMSLWTPWLHIGDLTTLDVSGVIVLDVSGFADTLCRSSESLLKAQEYAQQLAQLMNQEKALTDLWQCQVAPAAAPRQGTKESAARSMSLSRRFRFSWQSQAPISSRIVPQG
ncbi:unnamed protein product [Symbiodinium sp. CCMP2592]|nr:unnamed protein product [Symbiodinium sp. CCMP2592]